MGSMNWLGFSLSPQELPSQAPNQDHHHHRLGGYNSDEISGTGECFDLAGDSTAPSLNHLPPSFGIIEAFHRSAHNQSQDWNMLMGSQEGEQPKLENFLERSHSFRENNHQNNEDYMFNTTTNANPDDNITNPGPSSTTINGTTTTTTSDTSNNNGLNVSMIKTWLRSNHPSQSADIIMSTAKNVIPADGPGGALTGSQSLSLSMGTGGSQLASPALPLLAVAAGGGGGNGGERNSSLSESSSSKQQSDTTTGVANSGTVQIDAQSGAIEAVPRKSFDTFGQRTSIYRGVTRHRWTGRYEAHLWDNSCRREGQTRKGRQVYLGGYDKEEKAARAYDLAALKYWGTTTTTNFPISDYEKEIEEMKHMTRQEYVASLRRKSSGFSRGASIYRGVTRHHQHGRWQARIGRVAGNKDLYLGTFSTQEEAAEAYDIAAIKFRGLNAVTNFEINRYDVKAILESTTLPIGGAAKRLKDVEDLTSTPIIRATATAITTTDHHHETSNSQLTHDHHPIPNFHSWAGIAYPQAQPLTMRHHHHPYYGGHHQRLWFKQEYDSDINHQLELNNGTHNFFQMNNMMGLENSSLEHSSGSDSVVYGNGNGGDHCVGVTVGGYGLPFGTTVIDGNGNGNGNGYENYYNMSQQENGIRGAVGAYDQGSACDNWVPTAIPTLVPRTTTMAAVGGHGGGAPTFTVWSDT